MAFYAGPCERAVAEQLDDDSVGPELLVEKNRWQGTEGCGFDGLRGKLSAWFDVKRLFEIWRKIGWQKNGARSWLCLDARVRGVK